MADFMNSGEMVEFHDLLNDTDKSLVMQDIQDRFNARIPAALAATSLG